MKSSLRLIVVSVAIWFGLGAGTVNAVSYDLGTIGSSGATKTFNVPASTFFDEVQFELTTANFGGAGGSIPVEFGGSKIFGIDPLSMELFSGPNNGVDDTGSIGTFTQISEGTLFSLSSSVAAGTYHFEIAGMGTGLNGGAYLISVSPVPEPETYAMLLIGLGLVGFAARRRKNV